MKTTEPIRRRLTWTDLLDPRRLRDVITEILDVVDELRDLVRTIAGDRDETPPDLRSVDPSGSEDSEPGERGAVPGDE